MTKSSLFKYWTCKIAENPAIAEEFRVTKVFAIVGFYCISKMFFPNDITVQNSNIRNINQEKKIGYCTFLSASLIF